jgi:4-hydroxybenzoate polyprenyltransferase
MLDFLKKAILISRPFFWPTTVIAYLLGIVAARIALTPLAMAQALLLSFPFCFYMFGINDIFDRKTDRLNERKNNPVWGNTLEERDTGWVINVSAAAIALLLASCLFSGNPANFAIAVLMVVLAYIYSAPPLRLKEIPVVDSLFNAAYGFLPFAMGYSLSGALGFLQPKFVLFAFTFSAAHAIGTVVDMEADRKAGIRTFATEFGPRLPALFAMALFAVNVPFAFHVLPSAGLVLVVFAVLSAYIAIRQNTASARKYSNIAMGIFVLWLVYVPFGIAFGLEHPFLP